MNIVVTQAEAKQSTFKSLILNIKDGLLRCAYAHLAMTNPS